jgi:clathrin heavy chain
MQYHYCIQNSTPAGRIVGQIQLYSTEKRMSQVIEGHAAAFVRYQASESAPVTTLLTFASRTPAQSKVSHCSRERFWCASDGLAQLLILEVGEPSTGFPRKTIDIMWPSEAASDFPVALQASERYDLIYMITKLGFLYIWHIGTGTLLLSCRVTAETIFVSVPHAASGGFIGVNRKGQVRYFFHYLLSS